MPSFRSLADRRATLLILIFAGIAACSGQTCSCIQPIKGGFPATQRRENGVQTRLTTSFLQYVSDHAAAIVPGLIPTGTTFNIPPSCDPAASYEFCCGTPQPMCRLGFTPTGLQLTPAPPDKLHFDARIVVKTMDVIPVHTSLADCNVTIDTTRGGDVAMRAQGDIGFPVNANTKLIGLALSNATVSNIDTADVNLDEAGSDTLCGLANTSFIKGFIIDYVSGQVGDLVGGVVQGQLCETCSVLSDCSAGAAACTAGKCMLADAKSCTQLLGIAGRANVGSFVSGFSPNSSAYIDLMEAAGSYAIADTGLSLGVLGGSQADPHGSCVPNGVAPPAVIVAPSASLQGDLIPGTMTPYHIGFGIHISHLVGLLFSYWDAGGLCWQVEGESIRQLSASTLQLIMPSITQLLHTSDAPMRVVFRPQAQPTLTLGKGTFKAVGTMKTIDDPLITIIAKDLAADFYLLVDDRYVRVVTLTADMALPLGLDADATGAITLLAGQGDKAFTNLRISNAELLSETKAALEASAPTLISVALANTISYLGKFQLPTLAGISLHPKVITGVDLDATGAPQMVGVYSDVQAPNAIMQHTETTARVVSLFTPPTEIFAASRRDGREPAVTLEVGAQTDGRPFEWSWSFDGGLWNPYQTATTLTLTDPILWLQGRHVVSVRARAEGDMSTVDPSPVEMAFFIDSEAPAGRFRWGGKHVVAEATDRVSPREALRYRMGGEGDFVTAEQLSQLPVSGAAERVLLEARDEAGNVARLTYVPLVLPSGGCDVAPGARRGSTCLLVAGLWLIVLLRRRRRGLIAVAALALLPCLSACNHANDGDKLAPSDPIGRKHDAVLRDGTIHLAAYDEKYGDLAYAEISTRSLGDTLEWTLVDGDDPTSPMDGATAYRHQRTGPGNDVGYYNSIALDSAGVPHIAYWDASAHAVKLATGPFPFTTMVLDHSDAPGVELGTFSAVIMDVHDHPIVAYSAVGLGDANGYRSELRVAVGRNATPAISDWDYQLVDSTSISCGGRCAPGSACITRPMVGGKVNTNPAYSSCVAVDLAPCASACTDGFACIKSVCTNIVAAPKGGDLPQGTGLYAELIRGPASQIALAYYSRTDGQLRVAQQGAAGKFLAATIDGGTTGGGTTGGGTAGTNTGAFVSGAYSTDGALNLAYTDSVASHLVFRSVTSAGVASTVASIDDGKRTDGIHPVGASASLRTVDGGLLVLYQDQATSELELARYDGGWTHSTLRGGDSEGSGFSSHLLVDGATRVYSSWTFDRAIAPLGKMVFGTVP